MLENPNIAAQERHNNRSYTKEDTFDFVFSKAAGCKECGEWQYGKHYDDSLCDECRERVNAPARAKEEYYVLTTEGRVLRRLAFDHESLLRELVFNSHSAVRILPWSEYEAEEYLIAQTDTKAKLDKLKKRDLLNDVYKQRTIRRAQ